MGTITMVSNSTVASVTEDSADDSDNCSGIRVITVNVPAGTSKYISFFESGVNCIISPPVAGGNETINADKQYTLEIIGDNTTTGHIDQITCSVYNHFGGPLDAFYNFTREHNNSFC